MSVRHASLQVTLGLLKPSVVSSQPDLQDILKTIKRHGFEIVRTKRLFWRIDEAEQFYHEHGDRFFYNRLVLHATSGPFMALALAKENAIEDWRRLMGPTKVYKAQWTDPDSLRAKYGLSDTRNGFHGSDSPQSARKELELLFEGWDVEWWLDRRRKELEEEEESRKLRRR